MQQLEHAARALDWQGHLIPDVEILGARFTAVARLRCDVHRWRMDHGWEPKPDPRRFRSWSEPALHDHLPIPAIDLLGVLVRVSRIEKALRACGTLMTLAPCTVVLPDDRPHRSWPLTELDYYGIGVVRCGPRGPAEVLLVPEDRTAEFGSSMFGRWLLEVFYQRVLESDLDTGENASNTTGR